MGPFIADLLLVVHRDMRFSSGLVATLIREREHLKDAPISEEEVNSGYINAVGLVLVATFFGLVRTFGSWTDLAQWNPTHVVSDFLVPKLVVLEKRSVKFVNKNARGFSYQQLSCHHAVRLAVALIGLVGFPAVVVEISCASSPLIAYSALNATLNELFAYALQPAPSDVTLTTVIGERPWVETYIHPTEKHELFGVDSLYRRTTGFRGDLAFDVDVSSANPPNVLVLGVESFRYQDSRYMVGQGDPSNLFKGTDMTITPNFDRWAKRGVAMRNIWSSNPTSRSLESVLFAQVPYDSAVKTAITGGRNGTELSGLPQLFTQKGYETWFTTGSSIDLDDWDKFLPTHGFDTIWDNKKMMEIAESDLGIQPDDWLGDPHRGLNWGVHDDLSFQILGDLLVNKTKAQRERVASGEEKNPAFITHYTITSHAPFDSWPKWYEEEKPDFSVFYEGHAHAELIERYLTVRSFTDLELGKFMDRMLKEGVLNDTIVIITGDHGQAPEADVTNTHEESMTRVAAAIIAEGRLGDAVGMVIEDAVEQYDFLNTLADITGVPEGGFIQTGVGRSLKRKVPYGERVVFSNEPARKMSLVRGHQRLRYDQVSDVVTLHDTETDHAMNIDLFPNLTAEAQAEWQTWRDYGRRLAAYYTKRWDENCLLAVNCTAAA
ncbi:hypothetical protein PHYSODRAFT_524088 [Phytophthora sojae]|uniref:Sulfatase N-terminal domain-containing protein n=1 Tax=Phytophthora sojae (strain P6497) TaxID=1094619 RepID=G5A734_PHYSP|nr:hypothetical protein PHYSODRAFT_524088 [Phytophthora sojae]EGZ09139.1 hypothetical protein PHYSODRAFT_524088 [Phytophthora sojae]|eukprot:XP_009535772.1 hypothetical protein PHYSODRAFT_524088 [Phytophthora sojae]